MDTDKRKVEPNDKPEKKLFPIFAKRFKPHENPLKQIADKLNDDRSKKTPRRPRLLGKKETPGLTQMVLDAGQKHIGPRLCNDCGMLYSPGEPQDEKLHRQAHLRLENVHSITIWKDPRILQNYLDGGIVVMVQCNMDSKVILNRIRDFLAWLDSELSSNSGMSGEIGSSQRIFLYIYPTKRKKVVKILGCAVVELLNSDRVYCCPLNPEIIEDSITNPEKHSAQVGLTRLWTDPDYRKKQIATRLCDVIRLNSGILGYVVPKHKIAILEPTDNGRAFMNRYSEGNGLLYTYR